jgi:tetratricopeptide (TPR) repeat protein
MLKKFLAISFIKDALEVFKGLFFISVIFLVFTLRKIFVIIKEAFWMMIRILFVLLLLFSLTLFSIPRWTLSGFKRLGSALFAIPRGINWLFVIGFIVLGLTLLTTFLEIGLVFILVGILISPAISDVAQNKAHFNYSTSIKVIVAFLGLSGAVLLFIEQPNEKRFLAGFLVQTTRLDLEDEQQVGQLTAFIEREELTKRRLDYLERHEQLKTYLQSLHDGAYYQELVNQGQPYARFDSQIKQWVSNAETMLKQQQLENALKEVPQLIKVRQYQEAYRLAAPLEEVPELKKQAELAKQHIDKEVEKLRSLYERGHYKEVIKKGMPLMDSDCRVKKLLLDTQKIQAMVEERKRMNKSIQRTKRFMKARQYQQAIDFASHSEYAQHPQMQKLIERSKLQMKKAKEKKILAKLRNIPASQVESNIREYAKLLQIFPDNEKYQRKLAYYKQKLAELRRQPPLLITQEEYGDKWPFTVPKGKLECLPPGIVTFRVNGKTYAVNNLASSSGYPNINNIWREKSQPGTDTTTKVDILHIINKGLDLCKPLE